MGRRKTTEQFIAEAKAVHGDKYDYSKTEYKNWLTKICIICPIHGEFWQFPQTHLESVGCKKCSGIEKGNKMILSTEEFIKRARDIHGDKYDYSKVEYIGTYKKVCVICPKHGEFWQTPRSHLSGHGCPNCQNSILENDVSKALNKNNIEYVEKKSFDWLGRQHLDFYLPNHNIAIECQGEQHFISKEHFGGEIGLSSRKKLDKKKYDLCCENGIKVVYYTDNLKRRKMFDENIVHNNNDLIKIINNGN